MAAVPTRMLCAIEFPELVMAALPTVFVSHGSPMLALRPGSTGLAWRELAQRLPRPRAVLVASAHWLTPMPAVSIAARPETIHDFGGFPDALHRIEYPAPGEPEVAREVAGLLADTGLPAQLMERGLDHGAWVPLREWYPQADVPVLQLSLQPRLGPAHHYRLGQALRPLAERGVLVLGSGSLTHNLHEIGPEAGEPEAYVGDFQRWMQQRLLERDVDALLDYRRLAPSAVRAHPTEEHLLPIFVALGAAPEPASAQLYFQDVTHQVLAMDAYLFQHEPDAG